MTHKQRMQAAREARALNGLNENFSQQTAIRNKMVELRNALDALPRTDEPTITEAKKEMKIALADYAEQLYHLMEPIQ